MFNFAMFRKTKNSRRTKSAVNIQVQAVITLVYLFKHRQNYGTLTTFNLKSADLIDTYDIL